MKLQIKPGLEIGDGCPPFLIAEVGSNWTSLDDCLLSIEKAKECGADAVKFQLLTWASLYGPIDQRKRTPSGSTPYLPKTWLPKLKEKSDDCDIEFMCSAFSPELIDAVDPYVNIHKLASAEMCHVRMLERLNEIGKPVFMSTGAHTVDEITQSMQILGQRTTPLVLMYCVASYPAKEIELDQIRTFRDYFSVLCGYSDHSLDVLVVPQAACDHGACVLEKHFTALPELETPDRGHSLTPDQFKRMVTRIRSSGKTNRTLSSGPGTEENGMINRHNRRLIATQDISRNTVFREGINFGIFRSLRDNPEALSPFEIKRVEGQKAKKEIKAGDGIGPGDV